MKARPRFPVILALATLVATCIAGGAAVAQPQTLPVVKYPDIPYGPSPTDFRNWLDVYAPSDAAAAPVVMFVHGGAWASGDKSEYVELGRTLAGYYGIVAVVINYRLSPDVVHPAHTEDATLAAVWTLENIADYGGDPTEVFLFGHSAGGHIVSLMSTDESFFEAQGHSTHEIAGVISMSGLYNLNAVVPALLGTIYDTFGTLNPAYLAEVSPATHVGDWQPPFLIEYAETDLPTFDRQARNFYRNLTRHGSPATLARFDGYTHVSEIEAISTKTPESEPAATLVDFVYGIAD